MNKRSTKRKTTDDYINLASIRGITWLGEGIPKNTKCKTSWSCSRGHVWQSRYNDIHNGYGCPYCAHSLKKTSGDYAKLAASRGVFWLGPMPSNVATKTRWMCQRGHAWDARFQDISSCGSGCPICAYKVRSMPTKKTPSDYHILATKKGFVWEGPTVNRVKEKTWWRCNEGHRWETSYASVRQNRCPYCSGNIRKTAEDYKALAKKRGVKWLADNDIKNNKTLTSWLCPKGHVWESSYNNMSRWGNCPFCLDFFNGSRVSRPQRELCELLGGKLNHREDWHKYAIDIAIEKRGVNIAIEYDAYYWHDENRDKIRDNILLTGGWRIIRIRSASLLPSENQMNRAIESVLSGQDVVEIFMPDWEGPNPILNK